MKTVLKQTLLASVIAAGTAGTATADTEMVVVSWGGAYTASQQGAYHQPYMDANPGITIVNDDSAG
ncbi:MAG: putative spermidine/putrescine transport system substrate-binding protein, partial [Gammaproteobacteria bacterium]